MSIRHTTHRVSERTRDTLSDANVQSPKQFSFLNELAFGGFQWVEMTPEQEISYLSYHPKSMLSNLIMLSLPAQPRSLEHGSRSSSLGALDKLPSEILYLVFANLDLRSQSRMCRVSTRGKGVSESLTHYRDLIKYVPEALAALSKTGLASSHTAASLYTALRSESCVCCGLRGDFLFLPTCERCCYPCLVTKKSLWVIPIEYAKKCFSLKESEVEKLPILHSIPESVQYGDKARSQHRFRLVNVKSAKELALSIHGDHAAIARTVRKLPWHLFANAKEEHKEKHFVYLLQVAFLWESDVDSSRRAQQAKNADLWNVWHGTASIEFPILLPNGNLDDGYWCLGCKKTIDDCLRNWRHTTLGRLPPDSEYFRDSPFKTRDPARSKTEFLKHIANCPGSRLLIAAIWEPG